MGTVFPHQEVSVETLLRNSDLSPELLHQALLPLTSDKGPLTLEGAQNLPQEGKLAGSVLKLCGMMGGPEGGGDYTREGEHSRILIHVSPPCPWVPNRDWIPGVLRLRELRSQTHEEVLWLIPPQTYLSVEKDEGRTLEQKRNLLSCLLVRILKAYGEKGLHIDQLVCLVGRKDHALGQGVAPGSSQEKLASFNMKYSLGPTSTWFFLVMCIRNVGIRTQVTLVSNHFV